MSRGGSDEKRRLFGCSQNNEPSGIILNLNLTRLIDNAKCYEIVRGTQVSPTPLVEFESISLGNTTAVIIGEIAHSQAVGNITGEVVEDITVAFIDDALQSA